MDIWNLKQVDDTTWELTYDYNVITLRNYNRRQAINRVSFYNKLLQQQLIGNTKKIHKKRDNVLSDMLL